MSAGGRNKLPSKLRTQALQMVKDGYTVRAISDKLGISESAIRAWKYRGQVERPQKISDAIRMLQAWPNRISE